LLGVKAVSFESYERIHRANLVAWACCRCSSERHSAATYDLDGTETFAIEGLTR